MRLDVEAGNLARFRRNFRAAPHIYSSFPAPRPKLLTRAVLVESYEPGRTVNACVDLAVAAERSDADGTLARAALLSGRDCRHVVTAGKETYLQMLLVDNFVHAGADPVNFPLIVSSLIR